MESFTQTEDKGEKQQTLNLITHVSVQKACEHDSHALMPAIEDTQSRALKPKTVLAVRSMAVTIMYRLQRLPKLN